jgi:hypothetical protein
MTGARAGIVVPTSDARIRTARAEDPNAAPCGTPSPVETRGCSESRPPADGAPLANDEVNLARPSP